MQVIPVVDIRGGRVVRAAGGDRAAYRPIETPLAAGSDPVSVVSGLRGIFAFAQLYVADLDGVDRHSPDRSAIARLVAAFPDLELWIDNGASRADEVRALLGSGAVTAVIGSETWRDPSELDGLVAAFPGRIALSLDYRDKELVGPADLLARAAAWPDRIIVMTLARVGGAAGPDLERVRDIAALAGPERRVYAAGGVRGLDDLVALKAAGAAGALVATALHAGTIKAGDLHRIAGL